MADISSQGETVQLGVGYDWEELGINKIWHSSVKSSSE